MEVDIAIYRARIGPHHLRHFRLKGLAKLDTFDYYTWLRLLLTTAGDIESNPGPNVADFFNTSKVKVLEYLDFMVCYVIMSLLLLAGIEPNPGPISEASTISSNISSTYCDLEMVKDKFSIVHYNIQSLTKKLDIIESELCNFDIICLTETWLDDRTPNNNLSLTQYNLYRRDRVGDNHGGICMYVKQNIYSRRRQDLELPNIECVWVEISAHNKKYLIGTFYRPPNSTNDVLLSIEDLIALSYDTNIQNILITGDFNLDVSKQSANKKVSDLCQQFSLHQLIMEPTHYTEMSSSTIDLILTSNKNNVLLSGVGEPIFDQNIRYHCPVYCVLNFDKFTTPTYTRHIWLYDKGDYRSFSRDLTATVPPLCKNGIIYTDDKDKANILNQFFTDQSILDDTNATLPPLNQIPQHKLESISISPYEVEDILKTLKTGKAAGPDSIDNRLLKELSGPLSTPLTDL